MVPEIASPQPHISMICYLGSKWLIENGSSIDKNGPPHISVILLGELKKSCKKADLQIY